MWNLISLKEQSKMKMIEAFYKTNEPITINTLSELTNTSSRSIKNYLKELQETMNEIGAEFISSSEGVNFKIPINIGLDYFQKLLFKQSLGFNLLEKIFFDDSLTSEQLIQDLYISQSTLTRLVASVSDALKPYGLKLSTQPYRVVGDEQYIRHFYTTYFVEAYTANEWPFECLAKDVIDDILPSVSSYYRSTSKLMNYTSYRFYFAVGLIRSLNGHSNKDFLLENDFLATCYDSLSIEIEEKVSHLDFQTMDEKNSYITELTINQLFISKQVLYTRLEQDTDFKQRFKRIKQMTDHFTELFELPVEDQTRLILEIDHAMSFFANNVTTIQPQKYILYPPRDYSLVDLYRRKYLSFYDAAEHHLLLICEEREFEPTKDALNYLIYVLISKWSDLTKHLFSRYNTTVIKVFSHINIMHAQGMAESLISDLPNEIRVEVFEEAMIDEEIVAEYDFDILISAQTLNLDIKQPIIYMYSSRMSYQYEYLQQLIREIANKNGERARQRYYQRRKNKSLENE